LRRGRQFSLAELAPYLLEVPEKPSFLDWATVFGNDGPVEVEVGFGKGLFLIGAAQACPQVNFLGIEMARKYQLFTATRFAKRGLNNVRLVKADARSFLRDYIPPASCQAVHVYFPDPWWKKRHLKRRVFTADFTEQCERVLSSGGRLYLVSDVLEYFEVMLALCAQRLKLRAVPSPTPSPADHDLDYLTNFERKFRKEGRPIYRATYERKDS
jgi:tRNA (guanine-N7-)-methyltransferase